MSTFEIHDPADEQPISLAPEDPADELPEELQSPEDIAARAAQAEADKQAEIDRKAEETNSVINKFAGILKVIEDSPSLQRQAAPEQTPQLPPQPTQEQINEWNDKLRELQVTNPLQYATMMREGAVEEAQRRILSQSGGIVSSSAKGFVKDFKSEKKGSSPFYDQIAKRFDVEVKDLPAQAILQMSDEQRDREFTRRWKAAAGDFYEENAKPTQTLATTASRGTSMAPSSGTRNTRPKVVELSPGEKHAIQRGFLSGKKPGSTEYIAAEKRAASEVAKIEYGLA